MEYIKLIVRNRLTNKSDFFYYEVQHDRTVSRRVDCCFGKAPMKYSVDCYPEYWNPKPVISSVVEGSFQTRAEFLELMKKPYYKNSDTNYEYIEITREEFEDKFGCAQLAIS